MTSKSFNEVFSKNLKSYLNKNNMTQLDLSKRLGVGTSSVSNWCNGIKSPRMDKIDEMCKIFNCNRSNLMEERTNLINSNKISLTDKEETHIIKYRKLSDTNKKDVDDFIDFKLIKEEKNNIIKLNKTKTYEPTTIAAHLDGEELTKEDLEAIDEAKKFVKGIKEDE